MSETPQDPNQQQDQPDAEGVRPDIDPPRVRRVTGKDIIVGLVLLSLAIIVGLAVGGFIFSFWKWYYRDKKIVKMGEVGVAFLQQLDASLKSAHAAGILTGTSNAK